MASPHATLRFSRPPSLSPRPSSGAPAEDSQVRELNIRYWIGMVTLLILLVARGWFFQHAIATHENDEALIHDAGRLRTLTERLEKLAISAQLAILPASPPPPTVPEGDFKATPLAAGENSAIIADTIERTLAEWRQLRETLDGEPHQQAIHKGDATRIPEILSRAAPLWDTVAAAMEAIIVALRASPPHQTSVVEAAAAVARTDEPLRFVTRELVDTIMRESREDVDRAMNWGHIGLVVVIVMVIAQGMWVVRPAIRRLESTLARTERSDRLVRTSIDMLGIVGTDGFYKALNPSFARILGYAPEELLAKPAIEFVHPDDRESSLKEGGKLARGEAMVGFVNRQLTAHGTYRWVSWNANLYGGEVFVSGRDVTEERQIAEALRRSAMLVESSPDPFAILSTEGRVRFANQGLLDLLGLPNEQVVGRAYQDFVVPEDQPVLAEHLVYGFPSGESLRDVELRMIQAEGGVRWLAWSIVREGHDVFCVGRDITRRRAAEERLTQVTTLHQALLDAATVAIISTYPDGRIRLFNRGAERMLGWMDFEVVDQRTPALFHDPREVERRARLLSDELGETIPVGFETFVAKARRGGVDEAEWTYIRKDGQRIPVWLSVTAIREPNGEISGFLGVAQDITERKAVDRMKSEFVSTVSHELRTPLTSIRGSLGLIEAGVLGEIPEEAQELVTVARNNCDRLVRLINDILDLEKIEAGKLELKLEKIDARDTVAAATQGIQGMAGEAGVVVDTQLPETALPILGDRDRIVQVVTNLISNAIKFSPRGGRVQVELTRVVSMRRDPTDGGSPDRLRVSIRDEGPGIPPEKMHRLFGKFSQVDSSDTRAKGGTGLGLAISKAIVEQHRGTIGVDSVPGTGSTFWFELPLEAPSTTTPSGLVRAIEASPDAYRVLLVTSDADLAATLRRTLAPSGFTPIQSSTLEESFDLLGRIAVDAVLLDIHFHSGDALRLLDGIRRQEKLHDMPVLVLSGRESQVGSFGAPLLIDWLGEPGDMERLTKALRRAIRKAGQPTVLVVEDDLSQRRVIVRHLEPLGVRCLEAADGETALTLAREQAPDLIILDLGVPRVDGFGVVEALRQEKTRVTPLIVYTARDLDEAQRQRLTLGITKHLTKARASEEDFMRAVTDLLNGLLRADTTPHHTVAAVPSGSSSLTASSATRPEKAEASPPSSPKTS